MKDPFRRVATRTRVLAPDHPALTGGFVDATPDSLSGDAGPLRARGAAPAGAVQVDDPDSAKVALRMATAIVRFPSPPERCS